MSKFNKSFKLSSFYETSNLKNDSLAVVFLTYIISMTSLPFLSLRVVFYTACLMILIYTAVFSNKTLRVDWFITFLIYMLVLSSLLALFDNARFLEQSVNIGSSLILVALTSIFGVNRRSVIIASCLIIVIFLVKDPSIILNLQKIRFYGGDDILFVKTSHTLCFMGLLIALYFMLLGKVKYSILFFILCLPFMSRSGLLAFSTVSILFYLRNYIPQSFIKIIPPLAIFAILCVIFAIGIFYGHNDSIIIITKARSIFYEIIVNDILSRGLDILIPKYAGYSTEILSKQLPYNIDIDTPFYAQLFSTTRQCTHSLFLELLSDYGAILFAFMLFFFYKMTNRTNLYFVLFYVIFISFQCEAFNPNFIFPFYIFYYLSTRLNYHNSSLKGMGNNQ